MNKNPKLLGGAKGEPSTNFETFWRVFQFHHPSHEVYQKHGHRLGQVVPLLIHGDEGRAVKRTNYLVLSMETPFGSLTDPTLKCTCTADLAGRPDLPSFGDASSATSLPAAVLQAARSQVTNYKGHSYLSRWLLFGMGGWLYKKFPHIVDELFEELRKGMDLLFHEGVTLATGDVVFGALVAVKGDMDFHKKSFSLQRSYANVGSRSELHICHLCEAGAPNINFEDYSEEPEWQNSMYSARPWPEDARPVLSLIPFDETCPEKMLANDFFHIHKLGVCRDVIGGIVVVLARLNFFDHDGSTVNINDRLTRAHTFFTLWCKTESRSPGLRSFSMAFFNMKSLQSAPWVSCKGSDAKILLEWLGFTLRLNIQSPLVPGHGNLLRIMLQVVENCLDVYMVHRHGLWLEVDCARQLYFGLMRVLRGYSLLGKHAIRLKIRAFIQKPKEHGLHHIAWGLKKGMQTGAPLIPNPQMFATEINEDFMGRISRLSRRVGFKLCDLRVCERYFLKIVALLKKRTLERKGWVKRRWQRKPRK